MHVESESHTSSNLIIHTRIFGGVSDHSEKKEIKNKLKIIVRALLVINIYL